MIRKSMLSAALLFTALSGNALHAQKIEGTYEFKQSVMTAPDAPVTDVTSKLVLSVKGDSATGTWQMNIPGRTPVPVALRGVVKGGTITMTSATQVAKLKGADGSNETSLEVSQEFVLTVSGDDITGEITYHSTDSNVDIPSRPLKGKRVAG